VAASVYGYDLMGRRTSLTHAPAVGSAIEYAWTYDAASRVTGMTTPDGSADDITYDATDQLTAVDYSFQADEDYASDSNGNRPTPGYVTGAGNRLASDGVFLYTYGKKRCQEPFLDRRGENG
jgi:hypothetical protein